MVQTRAAWNAEQQSKSGDDAMVDGDLYVVVSQEIDTQLERLNNLRDEVSSRGDWDDESLDTMSLTGDAIADELKRLHDQVDRIGKVPVWRSRQYITLDDARDESSSIEEFLKQERVGRHAAHLRSLLPPGWRNDSLSTYSAAGNTGGGPDDDPLKDLNKAMHDLGLKSGTAPGIWKTKAQVSEAHLKSLVDTFDDLQKYIDHKTSGLPQAIALDAEFSKGKAQYAHIPWQVAAVSIPPSDPGTIVSAYWKYSTVQAKTVKAEANAVDDEKMKTWLLQQAKTSERPDYQHRMVTGLTANGFKAALHAKGVDERALLVTWGTTSADVVAFAKIWAGCDDLLVQSADLQWRRIKKLDLSQLVKRTTNLGSLSLQQVYRALFPDRDGLDWHDALADATATAQIAYHIYENRDSWL
ncbi:uncharacterized protein CC84DRAFT_1222837 [Paraphaeosphaeria sporulosa]|uniref:Uncharacterized protein n=1 Tax=Paraphaeosphaeria sporulosa TaxID=1460663 RepID=A0A177BWZ3_9PLEO|nr:uncharacterized protein CC84DRAFT_1222837 [Paraphaeosphaeria sporulosa]OAF99834.1 hypothetical protein CC84DRAFT_1222837 [Paraphaeosphaeria sporulosa]